MTKTRPHSPAVLAAELRPVAFRLYYVLRRQTPQLQLTMAQGSVLGVLATEGPQRIGVLAEREGVRMPTMTDIVHRLERLGLAARRADPADGRAVLVDVSDNGRELLADVIAAREDFLRERLATLDAADREAIANALPALSRLLEGESRQPDHEQDRQEE